MEVSSQKIESENLEITLELLWENAIFERYATAIWRLPKQNHFHFLADATGKPDKIKVDFEQNNCGFCFSPFINSDGEQTFFLKKDYYFLFDSENIIIETEEIKLKDKIFLEGAKKRIFAKSNFNTPLKPVPNTIENEKEIFENSVIKAKLDIVQNNFQKVVLSRRKLISLPKSISIIDIINNLSKNYPNAFISAIYLPDIDCVWLGASPELLVSLDDKGIFKTMSLAGTQSAFESDGSKISVNNARWSQKEIEEQAYVSRYVIECFKKVRVREYIENGPKTVDAGNLLHLQTDYTVDTNAIEFKQFATVLLELLHPTSAVCGTPKAPSLEFILKQENYDREFYCGFLGPVNINGCSSIFVNLRTMKLQNNLAYFYAGAGITEDSVPEKEWNETEMKIQTLLNVLN